MEGTAGLARRNRRVAIACVSFLGLMFALAYAAVPLYSLFCRLTGFAGTPLIAKALPVPGEAVGDHKITVRFDANIGPGLPWKFEPVSAPVRLKLGEPYVATFRATSLSDHDSVGTASYNVAPQQSGGFFAKVECFCFTEQKLKAHESAELSVSFYVDPDLAADPYLKTLDTITLSYTFFPARPPARQSAAAAAATVSQ